MKSKIKFLDWDSTFFDRKIGEFHLDYTLSENDINDLYIQAKIQNFDLLYIFSDKEIEPKILKKSPTLSLVDKKVIFKKNILLTNKITNLNTNSVTEYDNQTVNYELLDLAYLSGTHSRFRIDINFKEHDFQRLYKTWIENSVSKKIADKVFVINKEDDIAGMLTVKIKETVGIIGLLAVNPFYQRKGYAHLLIQKCKDFLKEQNIETLEVATQKDNVQACKFYENSGFSIKNITNIYHLWINNE